jgi:ribonuclease T2
MRRMHGTGAVGSHFLNGIEQCYRRRMNSRWLAPLVACAVLLAGPSQARERHASVVPSGQFDYYVLALSWSPVYCESHPNDANECGQPLGLVLHGLWPQLADGGHPSTCATPNRLDESARSLGARIYPSPRLAAHEWTTHGTCSGMTASDYFQAADAARNHVHLPSMLTPGSHTVEATAAEISSAVRDANPGLTNRSVTLTCAGNELSEVRICLSRDLSPTPCETGVRTSCGSGPLRIPGSR